ncbi:polymer-forming cytoskeletal-domain-containing protein [Tribonema minus]|uniref:Polymer-forming cytoskeletal-domain-containing protein n=1 Tax=Tribonema minus TaxID=303371 RepID=A0A836C7G0_9STRA|nr:polymer-forming cytoskeletal-domain-containing protein [Tribonema minus]
MADLESRVGDLRRSLDKVTVEDDAMIVGAGIVARGELEGCAKLVVHGHYEGDFKGEELIIGMGGKYIGDVTVERAVVAGSYEGHLVVKKLLDVSPGGLVEGHITYKEMRKAEGATVNGTLHQLS